MEAMRNTHKILVESSVLKRPLKILVHRREININIHHKEAERLNLSGSGSGPVAGPWE
jgi:hypothetical protein